MEHHNHGIKHKWERRYNESRTTIAYALIIVGVSFFFSLVIFWPQKYSSDVFNSRLSYHIVTDKDDYRTCNKDYRNFIVDDPGVDDAMMSFYLFNVTNVPDVIQRGYKPSLEEVGPYGYKKSTYKYNVTFHPSDDAKVSFQEYVELKGIEDDNLACSRTFFRMGRAEGAILNPCLGGQCDCKNHDQNITVVNPVFLRTVKEETAPKIMGHLSGELFEATRDLLENDFIVAVRSFTVHSAMQEIYLFRLYMQLEVLLNTSFNSLLQNYTIDGMANIMNATAHNYTYPHSCGLGVYGINACPFLSTMDALHYIQGITQFTIGPIDDAEYPSIKPLLIASNNISFLNFETGLPAWIGLTYYFGYLDFNFAMGYTMVNNNDFHLLYQQISNELAVLSFGKNHGSNPKYLFASNMMVKSIAYYIAILWLQPYKAALTALVYKEWEFNSNPVPCEPRGTKCIWQFAYMTKYRGNDVDLMNFQIMSLIDSTTTTVSNPNNILYDGNVAPYYNTHTYCTKVYFPDLTNTNCVDVNFTNDDALVQVPSGLWGGDYGYDNLNITRKAIKYGQLNSANHTKYFLLGCNISSLQYEVYPSATDFHDIYTIKYLNANADPLFTHQFDVNKFEELAWAQYGGGFVTYALLNVRTTFQIIRNGMWRYGDPRYYAAMIEFGSWAIYSGFPNHIIYNVTEARVLMYSMAANNSGGHAFRQFIVETGTTLVGDGKHFFHGVGAVGEVAYTPEFNLGNFNCTGENQESCQILNHKNHSSYSLCLVVQSYYDQCIHRLYYDLSRWVTNCARFVTSLSDPTNGISCSKTTISGQPHPYTKSRGNVMYTMLQAYTSELSLRRGLWCNPVIDPGSTYQTTTTGLLSSVFSAGTAACQYDLGGMFVNVAVKNILFEGYADPSVVKYINIKHHKHGIKFECADNPYDQCGIQSFSCNRGGMVLRLPHGNSHLLSYTQSRKDEYFAPYFLVTPNGSLIWPDSMTPSIVEYAESVIASGVNIIRVRNPVYAAYPGMNSVDKPYNRHVHEQARILNGMPGLFASTYDTLDTGRKDVHSTSNLVRFRGNTSITYLPNKSPRGIDLNISAIGVTGATNSIGQQPMSLWSGFLSYPTVWMGLTAGLEFYKMSVPFVFNKQLALLFRLSQNGFSFVTSKNLIMTIPLTDSLVRTNKTKSLTVNARRFIEDVTTWDNLRILGTPVDTYGMAYITPKGMASLENLAGFPIFAGTPNNWGNQQWGGLEYEMVTGLVPSTDSERTFIDYEPVTGRGLRTAVRQQLAIRVETNPLFMSAFTGQQLCIPPNKAYSGSSGYGCFAYIPMMWFEDGRTVNTEDFYRLNDHFYTRPVRAGMLVSIGVAIGLTFTLVGSCLLVRENARRRTFKGRIYVD